MRSEMMLRLGVQRQVLRVGIPLGSGYYFFAELVGEADFVADTSSHAYLSIELAVADFYEEGVDEVGVDAVWDGRGCHKGMHSFP